MPVIATPIAPKPECMPIATTPVEKQPVSCISQLVVAPRITTLNRRPLLPRMRSVTVKSGQPALIRWDLIDADGAPLNILDCVCNVPSSSGSASSLSDDSLSEVLVSVNSYAPSNSESVTPSNCVAYVKLRIRESLACRGGDGRKSLTIVGTIMDHEKGVVTFQLPKKPKIRAGIYFAEVGLLIPGEKEIDDTLVTSNVFQLIVDTSDFGAKHCGGLTVSMIRLWLRDSHPAENFLLDNQAWDDAEIAMAIRRPVDYWNTSTPELVRYNTSNFPYTDQWLDATCAYLFMMAAEHHRRNQIDLSAAGMQFNDMGKEVNYTQAAAQLMQSWKEFVRLKKAEINLNRAYGEVVTDYAYIGAGWFPYGY